MGLWHGVEYYEKERAVGEEFYQQWSNVRLNFFLLVFKKPLLEYLHLHNLLHFRDLHNKGLPKYIHLNKDIVNYLLGTAT